MAIDNVIDPTNCNPYSTASGDNKRACPKANMVDIKAEIRRSLLISFVFSNPDDNYKVLLSEGAKEIWEIDYVKDGELKRAAGKVRNFEYWTNKHIGLSTYSANGVIQRDEKIVVKFDASIDFKNQLLSIDVRNIRGLKPAGVIEDSELSQDSSANFIKVSKNAYNFLKVAYPKEYATLTKLDNTLNTDDTEYTDYMFDGALALNELAPLNLAKVKSANYMFRDNQNLRQVQLTTSDALASTKGMFEGCSKLEQVEISTHGVQNAEAMFKGCQALKALKLDVSSLTTTKEMFKDATALGTLRVTGKLNTGIDLTNCPLDQDSIASVLNSLNDNGPDEDKEVRFRNETVAGTLKATFDGATTAGWVISGLTFTETHADKEDETLGKDLVDAYEDGRDNGPTHEETHTETPNNSETHTEQPATPGTTETHETSTVTPVEPTHEETHTAEPTHEETHTETPAPSTEEHHEATPSTGETTVTTGTTEETHNVEPAHEETHTETAPATPSTSESTVTTEHPATTGETEAHTTEPTHEETHTEVTPAPATTGETVAVTPSTSETHTEQPAPATHEETTVATTTPAATPSTETTTVTTPETAPVTGTTEETHTAEPAHEETHTEATPAQPAAPATTGNTASSTATNSESEEELDPNMMLDAYNEGAN
jgi:cell wall protein, putative (cell wall adhesin, putative) (cell surface flocculin, putative)